MGRKAVFLDRDGTINYDKDYLYRKEEFEFIPGVIENLKEFRQQGYLLILITNQSGVARGYYTEEDIDKLHEYMQEELRKEQAQFDAIYYCPHHRKGIVKKYSVECRCRKPGKLLFERAIKEYDIDPKQSIAIGDKERDLIPAEELGIKGYLIKKNNSWDIK